MINVNIEYKQKLDDSLLDLLDSEFVKHSNKHGLTCNYNLFNFVAKDKTEVTGILMGHSNYDEIIIDQLVVVEKYRGKGIGTKLLNKVEEYHKNKGFNYISVFTHEFQAPKFYKKYGFKLEFKRENKKDSKLTRYFFIKYI